MSFMLCGGNGIKMTERNKEDKQREIDAWVAVWLTGNKKYSKRGRQNSEIIK